MAGYFAEVRINWRPLLAASAGLSGGALLNSYLLGVFAPHLLHEFGWTRSQFALVAANVLVMIVTYPFVGRLVDTLGVRRVAMAGVVLFPLSFVALSLQSGNFYEYFALTALQVVVGAATTTFVYTRLVSSVFNRARGLAFAIVNCAPAVAGAIAAPLLLPFIEAHGFRAGYLAIAVFTALMGVIGLALMPRAASQIAARAPAKRVAGKEYGAILRSGVFWIVLFGLLLCSLPMALHSTQLQLLLIANGAPLETAAFIISVYAVGVMAGRFFCGVALDRFSTPVVTALSMGMPAIGLGLLATNFDDPIALGVSLLFIGLSQGAEGDLVAYIVAKYFPADLYGTVLGLFGGVIGVSAAGGAILLSVMLKLTDSYTSFVTMGAVCVFVGALLFLLLGRERVVAALPDLPLEQIAEV